MNHFAYTRTFTNRISQRGLSLIELMISITIGLLILSALITLFVSQSITRIDLDKSTRLIDNGRYALEVLSDNLRLAGFYGESGLTESGTTIGDPCTTTPTNPNITEMGNALGLSVTGYNASGVVATVDTPPCSLTTADLKSGSDILVLRRADTTSIPSASAVSGTHYIQLSNCQSVVIAAAEPLFVIGNTSAMLTLHQRNCTSAANARRFFVQTYFISPSNIAGDGIPTLKVKELDPAGTGVFITTPLVEGIEYFQVEYGIDSNIDGAADSYVATCGTDAVCWSNVIAVKLYVIARNTEPTVGYTNTNTYTLGQAGTFGHFANVVIGGIDKGGYKRHVYTQVVRLINPSSRRESP
jgi:type IV pilus assembly protein PilW